MSFTSSQHQRRRASSSDALQRASEFYRNVWSPRNVHGTHDASWNEKFFEVPLKWWHIFSSANAEDSVPQLLTSLPTDNIVIILALVSRALGLGLPCCMTLGKPLTLSEPHFPHPRNEALISVLGVTWRLKELMRSGCPQGLEEVRT